MARRMPGTVSRDVRVVAAGDRLAGQQALLADLAEAAPPGTAPGAPPVLPVPRDTDRGDPSPRAHT